MQHTRSPAAQLALDVPMQPKYESAVRLSFALLAAPLACLAACGNGGPPAATTSGGAVTTASVTATAASVTATTASAAPPASAPTVPSSTPTASATAPRDAGAPLDAGAKPPKADAGAPDAGAVAATLDAGSIDAGPASGSDAAALSIAQRVDAIFAGKKNFSAKFTQRSTAQVAGIEKTSTGVVFIQRPDKFSFRYDPPNLNRIVSDGTTIKVYQSESSQMTELPAAKTEYPGALAFMMGGGIASSFTFTPNAGAKRGGVTVIDGKPLAQNPSYEKVLFFVDDALLDKRDPGAMRAILVLDAQKNRNRFEFENVTQPATIDPAEFTYTPPAGTNIVR